MTATMSSDRSLEEFLRTRNPYTIGKEFPYVPIGNVRDQMYDDITDALLDAMRIGSRARIRIALDAAFSPVTVRAVRWMR